MGRPSADKVAQRAFDLGLLDERELQGVWAALGTRSVPVNDFLQEAVRRELLTNYQVERLLKGETTGFFFGPYKVLYLVGSGTFARVYRAVHKETAEVVALKVLRNRFSENPAQYGQFVREGRLGCELRHPNIVATNDVYSHGKTHFLVMEFVEGWNLRKFVKIRKKVSPPEAIRLVTGICEGLAYAFEFGLTHRDLKMTNVLVSSRGEAKLVDFGLAAMDEALAEDDLADMSATRTVDYAALERATGVRKDDTRSDIYFLGCIFYNMLTGEPPLSETRDRLARLSKQRFLAVKSIRTVDPTIPDSVALVINKAMDLDPNRRYQTPAAMVEDLKIAAKRVEEEMRSNGPTAAQARQAAAQQGPAEPQHAVMVVESNPAMQDIFRNGFKRAGYRVLLTSDPDRALARFRQNEAVADCVVINAQQIGESALDTFHEFTEDNRVNSIPAVLLLDEPQYEWEERIVASKYHAVLRMPITMKQLRTTLAKLLAVRQSG